MDVATYLGRIGYAGPTWPSLETLEAVHRAHLLTVPFEDIDVYLQRPIELATPALFEKIVERRRGGFCYELNALFAELLRALGFDVSLLNAEVFRQDRVFGPPFDHAALLVRLDEPWLADVGFPRFPLTPLRAAADEEQERDGTAYRIDADDAVRTLVMRTDEGWIPQYRFDLAPRRLDEFADMCRFHATSPESPFYRWLGCVVSTPDGRISLSDDKLIVHDGGRRTERDVERHEIPAVLRERFGLHVDHDWTGADDGRSAPLAL